MAGTITELNPQSAPSSPSATIQPLRWWPALVLLVVMAVLRFGFHLVETQTMLLIQIRIFGPIVVAGLIVVWWLFFSRAGLREKLLALIGAMLLGAVAAYFVHFSLQGMGVIVNLIPMTAAVFALTAVLTSRWSATRRLPTLLAATAVAAFFWDSIQSTGITGALEAQYQWRWEKTAEELYLGGRRQRTAADPESAADHDSTEGISTLATAEWPSFRGAARDGHAPGVVLAEDWAIHPPREVLKDDGKPYTVYTPFRKRWENLPKRDVQPLDRPNFHSLEPAAAPSTSPISRTPRARPSAPSRP